MNHETCNDELMLLFDGELPPDRRAAVESHLASCAGCRATARDWETTRSAFRVVETAPNERFVRTVMARVEAARAPALPLRETLARWLSPVAAGLAFAGYLAVVAAPQVEAPSATDAVLLSEVQNQLPSGWLVSTAGSSIPVIDVEMEEI